MLFVGDFPPLKDDRRFQLVSFFQESPAMTHLEFEVMVVGIRMEPEFLQERNVLVFPLKLIFLRLLILELSEVHDLADRWRRIRYDLDQVETPLSREFDCLRRTHKAKLPSIIDHANLGNPDIFIYADTV